MVADVMFNVSIMKLFLLYKLVDQIGLFSKLRLTLMTCLGVMHACILVGLECYKISPEIQVRTNKQTNERANEQTNKQIILKNVSMAKDFFLH